jgi:hypothetical protein
MNCAAIIFHYFVGCFCLVITSATFPFQLSLNLKNETQDEGIQYTNEWLTNWLGEGTPITTKNAKQLFYENEYQSTDEAKMTTVSYPFQNILKFELCLVLTIKMFRLK